ncbi:MAG: peptidyl-tRNA hydrolase [Deltaproteobacteria bacterium]|nr:peptidyl-tRNA hydrolase [Deltaproteobacteria bacterium]
MWLIVGLGNPGSKYERNRHNIGFRVVDELARKHGLPAWTGKLGGEVTSGVITTERGRERAHVLKPMEFMNHSGFAVQRTAAFHKIDVDHIIAVHDELDLPFGVVRLKNGGGHGGHNGLRSMIDQLGAPGFARLRMGIGRDTNAPPGSKDAAGWVLSDFPQAHASAVAAMISAGCEDLESVLARGITAAMNQHNARPSLFQSPGSVI